MPDPVSAPPCTGQDMLFPFDLDAWPEDFAKEVKFGRAEPQTRGGRGANGTVVFNKKKTSVLVGRNLGHVALFASNSRQLLKLLFEGSGRRDPPGIRCLLAGAMDSSTRCRPFSPKAFPLAVMSEMLSSA